MKRLFLLVLAAMLCLGMLAACDAKKTTTTAATTTTPAPATTTTPAPVVPTTTPAPVDPTTTPAPVDPTTTTPEPTTTTTTPAPVVEYTVSFEVDGVVVDTAVVEAGQAVAKPAEDPSKLDYTFDYWTLDGAEYDFAAAVEADITLVAKFTAIPTFTVTFQGADVPAQTVKTGEKATKPADPEKAGFTFKGWTLNGEAYDFDAAVTADITLVAVFEEIIPEFTVTFEGADVAAQKVLRGQKAEKPADPEKDGYTFKGWTLGGEAYDFDAAVTADITLVAVFEENVVIPENVTVKFVDEAGTEIKSVTVAYGANVALPSNPDYFYSFAPADALYNVKADKTVVLTATAKVGYEKISQSPVKDAANPDNPGRNNPFYDDYYTTTGSAKHYGTILYRDGHHLTITDTMGGEFILNIRKTKAFDNNQEFFLYVAVDGTVIAMHHVTGDWKDGEYIHYLPNYGEHTVSITINGVVNVPEKNNNWDAAVNISGVNYMRAEAAKTEYTVKFSGDGVALDPVTVLAGEKLAVPTEPTRAGYTFKGWALAGVAYDFDAPVNADFVLVAVWEANSSYTVTFVDAEGNELGTSTVLPGASATLPAGETYWGFAPADALYNINEDKTVVLTPIAKDGYAMNQISMNYPQNDDNGGQTAYDAIFTVTGKTYKSHYGTLLWTTEDSASATLTGAGEMKFHLTACNDVDESKLVLEVVIDGAVVATYQVDKNLPSTWQTVYLPSEGEHTVTFRCVAAEGTTNKWGPSIQITAIQINQKTAE